jgi:hypothetical protein
MKRPMFAICVLLIGQFLPLQPAAADCIGYPSYLHWEAAIGVPGQSRNIAASGSYAYACAGAAGVQVLDVTDPSHPVSLLTVDTPGFAMDVAIAGNRMYLADAGGGLRIFDLSDPAQPAFLGSVTTPGSADAISVSGTIAVVACSGIWNGLAVVNVANPTIPVLAGTAGMPSQPFDAAILGSCAYVPCATRFEAVSLADPANPVIVGDAAVSGNAVAINGNRAYVADNSWLHALDLAIPGTPRLLGSLQGFSVARDVAVAGGFVYVSDSSPPGLTLVDASVPGNMRKLAISGVHGLGIAVSGHYAYVTQYDVLAGKVQIVDIPAAVDAPIVGSLPTPAAGWDVAINGNTAYFANGENGFRFVDVTNPQSPTIVQTIATSGNVVGVAVADNRACVTDCMPDDDTGNLSIIDPSGIVGTLPLPACAPRVAVAGAVAYATGYLADGSGMLQVVDIGNPAHPRLMGTVSLPTYAMGVAVSGVHCFVAASLSGLVVVNVTDPTHPYMEGQVLTESQAQGIALSGNRAYVTDADHFYVIDIADPRHPIILNRVEVPGAAYGVTLLGSTAYLSATSVGLILISVANPDNPTVVGSRSIPSAKSAACTFDYAYVVSEDGVFDILHTDCPTGMDAADFPAETGPRLYAYPNPAPRRATLHIDIASESDVVVEIFDAAGRRVRCLHHGILGAGEHGLTWNGCDEAGRDVAPGIYLARAWSAGAVGSASIVIMNR